MVAGTDANRSRAVQIILVDSLLVISVCHMSEYQNKLQCQEKKKEEKYMKSRDFP